MQDPPLPLSLKVAGCATLLSVVVGTVLAYLLARRRFPGRDLLEGLSVLPLVLPPTVLGYFLLVTFAGSTPLARLFHRLTGADLAFNLPGIVVAASIASLPLYLRQAQVAFAEVDPDLENAARTEGATGWQTFRWITVPLARRGLIAGAVLAFARALGDFGATLMVGGKIPGRTHTLALDVYDAWQAGNDRAATGLCLLLSAIALVVAVVAARLTRE